MIELRDSIAIDVAPARVWEWLRQLPHHYREWHPAHLSCRYERGESLAVGTVLDVEEDLHGRRHRLRLRATEVVPGRLVRYRDHGFSGAFLIEPDGAGSRFTAELRFGVRVPVVGRALDWLARRLLARQLAAIQAHMREEGANLKRLLERDPAA